MSRLAALDAARFGRDATPAPALSPLATDIRRAWQAAEERADARDRERLLPPLDRRHRDGREPARPAAPRRGLAATIAARHIAIVGAGPAGLMAAEAAAAGGGAVTVYERMPSAGRKLLLAGRGGLNLTHDEAAETFLARYGVAAAPLGAPFAAFDPQALRRWCAELGIDTFVGSSGRVFPASFKTSPLLRAWLRRLDASGVRLATRHEWRGVETGGRLAFATPDGPRAIAADAIVLALGGASWPHLGADGSWTTPLGQAGVEIAALRPANCGFATAWSTIFKDRFEGAPLKAVALEFRGRRTRGDLVVTRAGLEGGAIYALAPELREAIAAEGMAVLHLALRPDIAHDALVARLARRGRKETLSNGLRKSLGLAPAAVGLLREAALPDGANLSDLDDDALAHLVNALPLRLDAPMPISRAISTAGGVRFAALDDNLMLRARPASSSPAR